MSSSSDLLFPYHRAWCLIWPWGRTFSPTGPCTVSVLMKQSWRASSEKKSLHFLIHLSQLISPLQLSMGEASWYPTASQTSLRTPTSSWAVGERHVTCFIASTGANLSKDRFCFSLLNVLMHLIVLVLEGLLDRRWQFDLKVHVFMWQYTDWIFIFSCILVNEINVYNFLGPGGVLDLWHLDRYTRYF